MARKARGRRHRKTRRGTHNLSQLWRKVAKLTAATKPETKIFDTTTTNTTIVSAGTVVDFNVIAQGDGYTGRTGVKIKPRFFDMRANITMAPTDVISYTRIIIFRGIRENGITPTPGNILVTTTISSQYTWLDRNKYTILSDRTYKLDDTTAYGARFHLRFFGKKLNKAITYTGNGTGLQDGGIYMLMLTTASAPDQPAIAFQGRVGFTDV